MSSPEAGLISATPAHGHVLAAIHAASFPAKERWGADAMALQLGLPGGFGFLADTSGFVLARVAADEAEILTLAVVPEARRTGLASNLLRAALSRAASAGAAGMILEVAEDNTAARALYAGMGFKAVGRRRGYYGAGADALVMRLDIVRLERDDFG
jgi:ribosomal-protein-alanine N-acetyltransferase